MASGRTGRRAGGEIRRGLQFALGALEGTDIQKRDSGRLGLPDARTRHIRCDGAMYITADGELYTEAEVQDLLAQGD